MEGKTNNKNTNFTEEVVKGLGDLSAKFVEQVVKFADDIGVNRTQAVNICVKVLSYAMSKNVSYDKYEVEGDDNGKNAGSSK
jgi:hypothetical protein